MAKEKSFPGALFDLLVSLKLALSLFFVLAAVSMMGTILPALNNVYHYPWFRILLLMLCVNLGACTIDRLPKTIRLLRREESPFDSQRLAKFGLSCSITVPLPVEKTQSIAERAVCEIFGRTYRIESSGSFCAVSETGRWSRFMVHGVHLSVFLILAGGLVGSFFGFKGSLNLAEGQTSDKVFLSGGTITRDLPFALRCDKFKVSFYDTGAPKEYKSDLTIVEGGTEVLKKSIVVNDPLSYKGVTFYQASYGTTLREAEIELTDADSGKKISITLPFREPVNIPGTGDRLMVAEYQEDLMRQFGQALQLVYGKQGQGSSAGWILVDRPFHGNRIQNYLVRVTRIDKANFTGLEVKKDPGIWLVLAGFTLMTLAIGLTFYSSHKKLWVCVEPDKKGKKTIVTLAGRTSRNVQPFEKEFNALRAEIEKRLK